MKAVILARVSTKEQEEGHSIAAQKQRLKDYCKRKDLQVIKQFDLVESSTRGERKDFLAMLDFAKTQGETVAIVADAVDRVQRSFKESIVLDDLIRRGAVELHFYRENMVLGQKASASDVMRWDFSVMGAKSYVLQLSENVKRSLEYKLKNGEWTTAAPLGYLNARDARTGKATLEIDPVRAPLVTRIFQEYATRAYSINEMAKRSKDWGLRNRSKKALPLSASQVHLMLSNPFYCGKMRVNQALYPHRYENLISQDLFDRCQAIRLGRGRKNATKQTKNDFIFRSLLTCAVSSRKVTCDLKKGKYVYLICRNPEEPETKLFVQESVVLKQIEDVFKGMTLPATLVEALCDHLKQSHDAEKAFHHAAILDLERESAEIQAKLDRLLDLLLEKSITQDTHDAKVHQLKERQIEINQHLGAHHGADGSYRITVSSLISLASRAYELFHSSKNSQKRQLINFMFSNLQLRGEKLEFSLRSPFHLMTNQASYQDWLGDVDSNHGKQSQSLLSYR